MMPLFGFEKMGAEFAYKSKKLLKLKLKHPTYRCPQTMSTRISILSLTKNNQIIHSLKYKK